MSKNTVLVQRTCFLIMLLASICAAVEPGQPSKTSIWTAAARAIGAKNPDAAFRNPDYLAIKLLGPQERAILTDYPMDALDLDFTGAMARLSDTDKSFIGSMHGRTRLVDDALEEALRAGVRQVVVLGAGFDSRGYRFKDRLRGIRFFEVDYGPTQEHKKNRVKAVFGSLPGHVRYVAMDFSKDDLLTELRKGGYSRKDKTLFIWEGVVPYIPEAAVKGTLDFVREQSAPDSRIIFNYMLSISPDLNNPNSRQAKWGEPFIFGFPGDSAAEYVTKHGLEVMTDISTDELPRRYLQRSDGTLGLPWRPSRKNIVGRWCIARVPANR
jgi:methyltransferase (TIGR00027 family)